MYHWHNHATESSPEAFVRADRRVRLSFLSPKKDTKSSVLCDSKCQKFVLGKKSTVGDRPATRKRDVPISWERMPFIEKPLLSQEDTEEQKERVSPSLYSLLYCWLTPGLLMQFVVVWNEDGATGEPEEDEWE